MEKAAGYQKLMDDYELTQEQVARRVQKSRPAVANALRLLSLCPQVQALAEQGLLSAGHARAVAGLRDPELQQSVANKVIALGLSVRQTETLVAKTEKNRTKQPAAPTAQPFTVDYAADLERSLTNSLGRRVRLHIGRKKGRVELEYYGNEDLEQLVHALELFARAKGGGRSAQ